MMMHVYLILLAAVFGGLWFGARAHRLEHEMNWNGGVL